MQKINCCIIFLFLLIVCSCKSDKIVGSWEFIEVYQGTEITQINTLKLKKNTSVKGRSLLIFNNDNTFSSLESKGNFLKYGKILKMKYPELKDTTSLQISYIDKNYLLLSSVKGKYTTWYYKRVND